MCSTSACRRCSSASLRSGRRILSLNSSGGDHAGDWYGPVAPRDILTTVEVLTHGQAELQHVQGSFLLQEGHEAEEEVLLGSDLLQLQLQHLREEEMERDLL